MAGSDDLLTPEEIEALMSAARGDAPAPAPTPAPLAAGQSDLLSADDIAALFNQPGPAPKPATKPSPPPPPRKQAPAPSSAESTLRQAEQHLAAAVAPEMRAPRGLPPELGEPTKFQLPDFGMPDQRSEAVRQLGSLQDVELDLRVELGRTELLIDEVMKLREGSVVPLDKLAGDPVDIFVNGRMVARGEVLVLNDNFCVRVAEILTPEL